MASLFYLSSFSRSSLFCRKNVRRMILHSCVRTHKKHTTVHCVCVYLYPLCTMYISQLNRRLKKRHC
jgi:hypothetical protein